MSQLTIGERLKFLLEALNLKVGPFSRIMGVSDTNIRNYLDRGSKPSADFLENLLTNFDTVNPGWLLTGKGEPFISNPSDKASTSANVKKNSGVVGTNGTQYNIEMPSNLDECKSHLASALAKIESLEAQLARADVAIASKDALIASKEEFLSFLRGAHNRPN